MNRNPYMCLAIVVSLAAISVIGTGGMVTLAFADHTIPQALVGITSAAGGALAGALAVAPHTRQEFPHHG